MTAGCSADLIALSVAQNAMPADERCHAEEFICERLRARTELLGLRGEWNSLLHERSSPFHRWEWLENWWRFYSTPQRQLFALTVRSARDGQLVALLPLYLERSSFRRRVLRFLGGGEVCTDYNSILIRPGYEAAAISAFANGFAAEFGHSFDAIELNSVLPADPLLQHFAVALGELGFSVSRRPAMASWRAELAPDWEQQLAALSRNRRWRARKLHRDYLESGRTQVKLATDDVSFHYGFDILVDLHQRRRESLGDAGCFASDDFHGFLRAAGSDLLAAECLDLQWLELDGKPIAAEIDLRHGSTTYLYQSGIDPTAEQHGPGWQAVMVSLQRACNRQMHAFDFLRGDESYKASWGATKVPLEDLVLVPPRFCARLQELARRSTQQLQEPFGKIGRGLHLR